MVSAPVFIFTAVLVHPDFPGFYITMSPDHRFACYDFHIHTRAISEFTVSYQKNFKTNIASENWNDIYSLFVSNYFRVPYWL